jgi:hypothetical protein
MKLKGIISMFLLMLYAMGSIGGFGYAMYCKAYLIAVAVLVLAIMAFPTAKRLFQEWTK